MSCAWTYLATKLTVGKRRVSVGALVNLKTTSCQQLLYYDFVSRSGNILSFLLPLFQEGQLSVTGESMCTKYWLTA